MPSVKVPHIAKYELEPAVSYYKPSFKTSGQVQSCVIFHSIKCEGARDVLRLSTNFESIM